jgi:hypothetical protein
MPSGVVESAPVVRWSGDAYRLIPSRFPPVNVYEGLVANDRLEEVYAAEDLTNPRLRSLGRLAPDGDGSAAADPKLQNWNLAPFAYGNPDGTLFFDERRPCLEVAGDRQTALAVSVARRELFLGRTQEPATGLDMRMLRHPVDGMFWDLREMEEPLSGLDLASRRALGAQMPPDAQGILYRCAERPAGTCIAVTTGDVLERSIQTIHFRYVWDGKRVVLLYVFNEEGKKIQPETLAREEDVLAA